MANIKNPLFQKHYRRLVLEGVINSALWGAFVGFGATFLVATLAWIFGFGGIWLPIVVGACVGAATGVLCYFLKYRPDAHAVASRVDRLGLEERTITMLALEQEESVIANLQRENAKASLQKVEHVKIKFRVPVSVIVMAAVAFVLGSGMTTVSGLVEEGAVPPLAEIINPVDPLENHLSITYEAMDGGVIEGETMQLLLAGESTSPVVAVADDGWMFVGWDDGIEEPERAEDDVQKNMIYTAIFQEIMDGDSEGDGSEGEQNGQAGSEEGDSAEDVPEGGEANVDEGQSGEGSEGSGSNSDGGESEGTGEGQEEGEGKGDGQGLGAGGKFQNSNQFYDGQTYYRDHLEMYYELAQEIFAENGEIPPEMLEFFETYFGGIQ